MSVQSQVKEALIFYGKYQVAQTLSWAATNPGRAIGYTMAGTAAITNPTARSVLIKIAGHMARQAAKDALFYSRLIVTDVAAPVARSIGTATRSAATRAVTSPAVAVPVVVVTAATAGGVASAAITTGINRTHNVNSSSPTAMWSPFGGMQLGTVV